ncbi:putative hydro-lyase [Pseudonocardia sichuanensis]
MSAADLEPREVRARIRSGAWRGVTTGACLGHVQANLVVLPREMADEFGELCAANPQPLPLLERTDPGDAAGLRVAPGADLRTDLPRYHVLRHGVLDAEVDSLAELWRDDFVAFLLGCSFSAENQLLRAGVRLRHLELGQGVPMFVTSLDCVPAGRFHGPVVVSMRPVRVDQLDRAVEVTSRLPFAHGAPVHVGDPAAIGVSDLTAPDWGDAIEVGPDEVPVFWACGVTPQAVLRRVRPEIAVTHAPGHMFVTDLVDAV